MSLTSTEPGPLTWTLRLKHHKTTILVHARPIQSLAQLKDDLLAILQERFPNGLHGYALPTSSDDIRLAKPVDPLEISLGWDPLEATEIEDPFNMDEDDEPQPRTKKVLESENLKAYGIKDNAVLAFRFRSEKVKGGAWDVVQAVNIDEFGVENEGDMGVMREYKG